MRARTRDSALGLRSCVADILIVVGSLDGLFVTWLNSASVGFVMLCRLLWREATCTTMCGGTLFFCLQTEGGVGPLLNGKGAKLIAAR